MATLFSRFQGIFVLARTTFTQLVRMKVFLFLSFFVVLFFGASTFRFSEYLGPETVGEQELTLFKNSVLGMMRLFGLVFSVTATALLIPKDAEDRILYTLLCRPLPRWQYLAGKLLGVMAVIIVVMGLMDGVFCLLLEWRTSDLLASQQLALEKAGVAPELMASFLGRISEQGVSWNLQLGVAVLVLECLVLCSLTLFLSIISTSTLFSVVMAFALYFIGLFQMEVQSLWFGSLGMAKDWWQEVAGSVMSLLFPNFKIFALVDSAVEGKVIPLGLFAKIGTIALAYMLLYMSGAALIFKKKEF